MSTTKRNKHVELAYKLKQAQHSLRNSMDETLKSLELTTPQYAVLSQLETSPGISNAQLARSSFVTAQTMHGIVLNLEKNNLVRRKRDLNHGRILCTELTKKGKRTIEVAHAHVYETQKLMTRTLSKKNIQLFEEILNECIKNLQ
ncbi:MAG: MarR family transcriptional regulator [Myxococcales bacterium]|nr:MarR family transcriptional regulator [Myxococcales bacterium]USN50760.1 MAG: MarR family transcriptional regulator [Myxococcales bacterium]